MTRIAAFLLVLVCALVARRVDGELLQRLHVTGISVTSDTQQPRVNVPFHVTLTIHVRERITQLQFVSLPTYSGLENIGDQHSVTNVPGGGSIYHETLTLVAHAPGPVAIGSAYLDAVDLRDGKTKRFISNDLILHVMGTAVPESRKVWILVLLAALALILLAALIFVLARLLRKRRVSGESHEAGLTHALAPPRVPPIPLDEALDRLRMQRDRASVVCVREALWDAAEAHDGETLDDVLRREPARRNGFRRFLVAIERAMFVPDAQLSQAIEHALSEGEQRMAQ